MQNGQTFDELSLVDIIKILFKKWWILLIAFVVGAGTGALAAFLKNNNKTYYGTTVMFYVNPVKEGETSSGFPVYGSYGENVTETMVVLLESEYFAQQLLSGISGIPEKEIDGKPNAEYFRYLKIIQSCTSFNNKDDTKDPTAKQPNNIFYATISVLNDYKFAQILLDRILEESIVFVEMNMPVPNGYQSTKCETISVSNQIEQLNVDNTKSDMLKYGVLLGAAAFIVGCIVVLVMENAENKKARKEEHFENSQKSEN